MHYSTLTNDVDNDVAFLLVLAAFAATMAFAVVLERRALRRGRHQGRADAVNYLRARAAVHQGQVGDARRRSALNRAADDIRDGRLTGVSR